MERVSIPVSQTASPWKMILPYALIYFFISLGDAVMSYVSPIYVEQHVSNPALMGLIISSSSVVGILCDFLFSKIFKNKSHLFFIWSAVLCALLFPAGLGLLPPGLFVFLAGMAIWGIYYELLQFSDFNFIKQTVSPRNYSAGWGILSAFKATAYFLGPLLVGVGIVGSDFTPAFMWAIVFTLISGIILVFYSLTRPRRFPPAQETETESTVSWTGEFRIWLALVSRIWPVYLFIIILYLIDSAFWTIGTLFSEEIRQINPLGGFIIPAYSLPTLFMGLIIGRVFPPTGKKRLAFITAAIAGLLLSLIGFITQPVWLVVVIFASSLLLSVTFPEIAAVFEDYVTRLKTFGNDMVGLQSSASSLAYIIGPILAGAISAVFGNHLTFTFLGLLLFGYSLFALFITPRKIRLPQQELQNSI